jgi:NAD(P)-dependent dehydrogenase (short-subunit alcohol dehydrogenase family)
VADAASAKAISGIIDQALQEEGHLDFFFANAGVSMAPKKRPVDLQEHIMNGARRLIDIPDEEFAEIMRINALR